MPAARTGGRGGEASGKGSAPRLAAFPRSRPRERNAPRNVFNVRPCRDPYNPVILLTKGFCTNWKDVHIFVEMWELLLWQWRFPGRA